MPQRTTYQGELHCPRCYAYLMRLAGDSARASNPLARSSLQSRDRRGRRVSTGKISVSTARVQLGRQVPETFLLVSVHPDSKTSLARACKLFSKRTFLSKGKVCPLICRLTFRWRTKCSNVAHTEAKNLSCRHVASVTLNNNNSSSSNNRKTARADRNNRSLQGKRRW